jgi:hypothetical protein
LPLDTQTSDVQNHEIVNFYCIQPLGLLVSYSSPKKPM